MKVSIVHPILFTLIFQIVDADIKDFIISDESDLRRFEDIETDVDSFDEMEMELEMFDSDSEMNIYDTCHDSDSAERYLPAYNYIGMPEDYDEHEFSEYSMSFEDNNHSPEKFYHIKRVLGHLARDARYAAFIERIGGLEGIYSPGSCQGESYTDMIVDNHNEDCN